MPWPSRSIVLRGIGLTVAGIAMLGLIGWALFIRLPKITDENTLATHIPAALTQIFIRTTNASDIAPIVESLTDPPISLPDLAKVQGTGPYEFALLSGSGGTLGWMLYTQHENSAQDAVRYHIVSSDDVTAQLIHETDAKVRQSFAKQNAYATFAASDQPHRVFIAKMQYPKLQTSGDKVLQAFIGSSEDAIIGWGAGSGSVVFQKTSVFSNNTPSIPSHLSLYTDHPITIWQDSAPAMHLQDVEKAAQTEDASLTIGIRGIALQLLRDSLGNNVKETDLASYLEKPATLELDQGTGSTFLLHGNASAAMDEALSKAVSSGAVHARIRNHDFLGENTRTDIIADEAQTSEEIGNWTVTHIHRTTGEITFARSGDSYALSNSSGAVMRFVQNKPLSEVIAPDTQGSVFANGLLEPHAFGILIDTHFPFLKDLSGIGGFIQDTMGNPKTLIWSMSRDDEDLRIDWRGK